MPPFGADSGADPIAAVEAEEGRRHVLTFDYDRFQALRRALLETAPIEAACLLLARPARAPGGGWRLVVFDAIVPTPETYIRRNESAAELRPEFVASVIHRARAEKASVVLAHSHPFADRAAPSPVDIAGEARLVPVLRARIPGVPHARLILGRAGQNTALFGVDRGVHPLELAVVGSEIRLSSGDGFERQHRAKNHSEQPDRHDRQVRAFGSDGQQSLERVCVAVIGLGGTGSIVAQQLAHLGVRNFLLIDPDVVEQTNLNRVVGTTPTDVGRSKVAVARDAITRIHPDSRVTVVEGDIRDQWSARMLLEADTFFLCTDSHGSRAVASQFAYQYLLPGFDVGVAIHASGDEVTHISGRVQMLAPGLPCLVCTEVLDSEAVRRDLLTDAARAADPYVVGAAIPQPAVISINSAASSLAVTMFLSAVTGIPYAARHQRLRLESGIVTRVETVPRPKCPICSPHGALGRADSWQSPGRLP
jgi:molybdopterin-synthase adenylyltransferase